MRIICYPKSQELVIQFLKVLVFVAQIAFQNNLINLRTSMNPIKNEPFLFACCELKEFTVCRLGFYFTIQLS